jgi:DNA polymerase III sliding clamp (beta) subunit (PCNA family)
MKLVVQRNALSTALGKVELALTSGIDLYRQIHLELNESASPPWVVLTGTSTMLTIKTAFAAEEAASEGGVGDHSFKILLPPEAARAARTLPDGEVTLTSDAHTIEFQSEHGPRFKLRYSEDTSYPEITFRKKADFSIPLNGVLEIIGYINAIAKAETVLFESNKIIVTDGFRIGVIDTGAVFEFGDEPVVVPTALFHHAEKVLTMSGDVQFIVQPNRVTLRQGRDAISVLRSSKKFPNYKSILESSGKDEHQTLVVKKADLLAACDRARVLTGFALPMRLILESGGADMLATRADVGDSQEHIKGKWFGENPMTVGINIDLFRPIVQAMTGDEIALSFSEPKTMFQIDSKDDPFVHYIMMPVRLPE